jgi:diguanylate cyclase (GGDEF)-like protein/PAS domain S-box-containing protein
MAKNTLSSPKNLKNIPLGWVLVVPFVLQIVGAVGLVGYLSYRTCEKSVETLASRLMVEVGDRVDQHLDSFLGNAQKINHLNLDAVNTGILDLKDFKTLGKYFYHQRQSFDFAYVNFGSQEGGFIGSGNSENNDLEIGEISPSNPDLYKYYAVNKAGDRGKLLGTIKNPQTNDRAWYLDAVKAGKPIWSEIYTWGDLPDHISLSASAPVYDSQKKLLGVLGIDLELSQISRFLKDLKISQSGTVFIVDRTGLIVASSADESPAPVVNGNAQRLAAVNSKEPFIRDVTQDLIHRFGNLKQVKNSQLLRPSLAQNPFVKVRPYQQGDGLDWLVVTVIPESEFMGEIQANTNRTILLCGITLLLAIASGLLTTRLIVRPIRRLSQASSALAQGEWQENLSEEIAIAEIQTLSISFNQMATQIRQSFEQVEGELQGSREMYEKMYRKVVQTQTDFILRSQPDTTILLANPALCKALGTSLEKIIGQKWIDFADPDDLEMTLQQISQLSPENPTFIAENRDQRANKKIGWTQWINQGIFNEEGQLIEIQSVGRDITELKQTETQLRESQRFIERIAEATPTLLYIYDQIEQRNIYANRSVAELLGYSREEIQTMGTDLFATICHPDDLAMIYEASQKICTVDDDQVIETEYRVQDAQGEWHWLASRDLVFSRTEDGQVWQTLGTSQDITDRVESENRLTQLARNIPGMIYQFRMRPDGTSHFPYTSEGIRDIYGVTPQEVRLDATPVFSVLYPDDLERINQSIQESAEKLSLWNCEYRVNFADGRIIWVLGHATPRREADGSTLWHGYITDISDRKQAEFLLISEKERAEEAELKLQKTQIVLERINQKLLKLIDTDPLTRIANRRCFNIRFKQEWKRLLREQKLLSLILFDVDYFKNYNTCYGHPQGDRCLIKIAQTAKETVKRSTDLVARIGGEEFAVILPDTNLEGAKVVAEKIRLAIQSLEIPHQGSKVENMATVSISLGIMALIPTRGQSPTNLISQADQALFQAKKQGRNQSVIFSPIPDYNENH